MDYLKKYLTKTGSITLLGWRYKRSNTRKSVWRAEKKRAYNEINRDLNKE